LKLNTGTGTGNTIFPSDCPTVISGFFFLSDMISRVLLRRLNTLRLTVPTQTLHKLVTAQGCLQPVHQSSPLALPLMQQVARISTTIPRRDACSFNVQDDEDFKKRVLESDKPVIVDFHAS
jgi:hypothetical protein